MGRTVSEQTAIAARNALVESAMESIRNVAFMVLRNFCANVEVDDLIQQGALGAMQAAETFDPGRGIPFAAYAYLRIRGAMYDSVRRGKFREIAMVSLDDPTAEQHPAELETIDENAIVVDIDNQRKLARVGEAMKQLNERQKQVVAIHYLQEKTLREAAERINLSAPRAQQIRSEAIAKLRDILAA